MMPEITKTPDSQAKWVQLGLGLVAMMAISSPQYVWTLFAKPFETTTGAAPYYIQITFSLLIVLQTFFSPAQGYLIDKFGPRVLITLGCALSGLGWVLSSYVSTLTGLYLTYGLFCGIGTGIVYIGVVGLMVRWFPNARGFATGIVAAGYGFGAIATTFPISDMIKASGYRSTLLTFGLILGGIGMVASFFLRMPKAGEVDLSPRARPAAVPAAARDYAPKEMLKHPAFWLMFVMMTMMSTGGLMVISQFAAFSRDFGVADMVLWGAAALPWALTIDRITNGLTRPFFGFISDRYGRENTMVIAFTLEAAAVALLVYYRQDPLIFVLLSAVVFFGWGEIFSLFPSTLTDTFGTKHGTTNYGFLYMAQGIGSILGGPIASLIRAETGSWMPVFGLIIAMDLITAILAFAVLKPMRQSMNARSGVIPGAVAAE